MFKLFILIILGVSGSPCYVISRQTILCFMFHCTCNYLLSGFLWLLSFCFVYFDFECVFGSWFVVVNMIIKNIKHRV